MVSCTCIHLDQCMNIHCLNTDLVKKLEMLAASSCIVGPVGILILHLEPYDRAPVGTLQWNQDLEQSSEVSRHSLCIGSIVGT